MSGQDRFEPWPGCIWEALWHRCFSPWPHPISLSKINEKLYPWVRIKKKKQTKKPEQWPSIYSTPGPRQPSQEKAQKWIKTQTPPLLLPALQSPAGTGYRLTLRRSPGSRKPTGTVHTGEPYRRRKESEEQLTVHLEGKANDSPLKSKGRSSSMKNTLSQPLFFKIPEGLHEATAPWQSIKQKMREGKHNYIRESVPYVPCSALSTVHSSVH